MFRSIRIVAIALAALALAATAATAMPAGGPIHVRSLGGPPSTAAQKARESLLAQERYYQSSARPAPLTGADKARLSLLAEHRYYQQTGREAMTPPPVTAKHVSVRSDDDGPSPLLFILPSLGLAAMLGAATLYVRTGGHARSHA
jgi:hypothetical protein